MMDQMGGMMNGMGPWGWLWMLTSWLIAIAFLVLIVVAIVWLVRHMGPGGPRPPGPPA
jgi:hypothetical protein